MIAERAGQYGAAADEYVEAARYSQSPWLDYLLEARAAKARAGPRPPGPRVCTFTPREPGQDSPLGGGLLSDGQFESMAAASACRVAHVR